MMMEYMKQNSCYRPLSSADDQMSSLLTDDVAVADITKIGADVFAKQITLIELSYFKAIRREEFTSLKWNGKEKHVYAPNIVASTRWFNQINFWVQKEILKYSLAPKRSELLAFFIKIAKKLVSYNNLYSAMSIMSALQVECVYRLRHTWDGLSNKDRATYRRLEELFSQDNNCQHQREHMKSISLPGIPYLGLYLSDLTYTNVAHPRTGGKPTPVWMSKINAIVDAIEHFQQSEYSFHVDVTINAYLCAQKYIEELQKFLEDDNYRTSLRLEPPPPPTPEPSSCLPAPSSEKQSRSMSVFQKLSNDFSSRGFCSPQPPTPSQIIQHRRTRSLATTASVNCSFEADPIIPSPSGKSILEKKALPKNITIPVVLETEVDEAVVKEPTTPIRRANRNSTKSLNAPAIICHDIHHPMSVRCMPDQLSSNPQSNDLPPSPCCVPPLKTQSQIGAAALPPVPPRPTLISDTSGANRDYTDDHYISTATEASDKPIFIFPAEPCFDVETDSERSVGAAVAVACCSSALPIAESDGVPKMSSAMTAPGPNTTIQPFKSCHPEAPVFIVRVIHQGVLQRRIMTTTSTRPTSNLVSALFSPRKPPLSPVASTHSFGGSDAFGETPLAFTSMRSMGFMSWRRLWVALILINDGSAAHLITFEPKTKNALHRNEFKTHFCEVQNLSFSNPTSQSKPPPLPNAKQQYEDQEVFERTNPVDLGDKFTESAYSKTCGYPVSSNTPSRQRPPPPSLVATQLDLGRHRDGSIDPCSFLLSDPENGRILRFRPLPGKDDEVADNNPSSTVARSKYTDWFHRTKTISKHSVFGSSSQPTVDGFRSLDRPRGCSVPAIGTTSVGSLQTPCSPSKQYWACTQVNQWIDSIQNVLNQIAAYRCQNTA